MRLRRHAARIIAGDVRRGDQVRLAGLWWPVEHVHRIPEAGAVELSLAGLPDPLTVPRTEPVTACWPVPARGRP